MRSLLESNTKTNTNHRSFLLIDAGYKVKLTKNIKNLYNKLKSSRKQDKKILKIIEASDLFDENWYVEQYPEIENIGIMPARHYLEKGGYEGKNPSPKFDSSLYLKNNTDVKNSNINPLSHYLLYGIHEDREIFNAEQEERKGKIEGLTTAEKISLIEKSNLFDYQWYLKTYNLASMTSLDAATHYLTRGASNGFDPSPIFSTSYYIECNRDKNLVETNPLLHYIQVGESEKRQITISKFANFNLSGEIKREQKKIGHKVFSKKNNFKQNPKSAQKKYLTLEELEETADETEDPAIYCFKALNNLDLKNKLTHLKKTVSKKICRLSISTLSIDDIGWCNNNTIRIKTASTDFYHTINFYQLSKNRKLVNIGNIEKSASTDGQFNNLYPIDKLIPILFVVQDKKPEFKIIPFPTLLRNGLHSEELEYVRSTVFVQGSYIQSVENYSYLLIQKTLERDISGHKKYFEVLTNEESNGFETLLRPNIVHWLKKHHNCSFFSEEPKSEERKKLLSQYQTKQLNGSKNSIRIECNSIPTLGYLTGAKEVNDKTQLVKLKSSIKLVKNLEDASVKYVGTARGTSDFPASIKKRETFSIPDIAKPTNIGIDKLTQNQGKIGVSVVIYEDENLQHLSDCIKLLNNQKEVSIHDISIISEKKANIDFSKIIELDIENLCLKLTSTDSIPHTIASSISNSQSETALLINSSCMLHNDYTLSGLIYCQKNHDASSATCIAIEQNFKNKKFELTEIESLYFSEERSDHSIIKRNMQLQKHCHKMEVLCNSVVPIVLLTKRDIWKKIEGHINPDSTVIEQISEIIYNNHRNGEKLVHTGKLSCTKLGATETNIDHKIIEHDQKSINQSISYKSLSQ